jgi:hypothetical protein
MELKRSGRHEFKEIGWKEHHGIQNIGTEDSKGNAIVAKTKVLRIWERYITELYDRLNQTENLEVVTEKEVDASRGRPLYFAK